MARFWSRSYLCTPWRHPPNLIFLFTNTHTGALFQPVEVRIYGVLNGSFFKETDPKHPKFRALYTLQHVPVWVLVNKSVKSWSRSSEQKTYFLALFPLYVGKIGFLEKINGFYSWGFLVWPMLANRLCRAFLITSRRRICTVSAVIPRTCCVSCLTLRERIDQANRQR